MTEPFSIFEASRLVHLTYLMANEFLEKMNSLGCFSLGGIFFFFFVVRMQLRKEWTDAY